MAVLTLYKIAKDSKKQQHKNHNPYAHIAGSIFGFIISNINIDLPNTYDSSQREQTHHCSVIIKGSGEIQPKQGKKHA